MEQQTMTIAVNGGNAIAAAKAAKAATRGYRKGDAFADRVRLDYTAANGLAFTVGAGEQSFDITAFSDAKDGPWGEYSAAELLACLSAAVGKGKAKADGALTLRFAPSGVFCTLTVDGPAATTTCDGSGAAVVKAAQGPTGEQVSSVTLAAAPAVLAWVAGATAADPSRPALQTVFYSATDDTGAWMVGADGYRMHGASVQHNDAADGLMIPGHVLETAAALTGDHLTFRRYKGKGSMAPGSFHLTVHGARLRYHAAFEALAYLPPAPRFLCSMLDSASSGNGDSHALALDTTNVAQATATLLPLARAAVGREKPGLKLGSSDETGATLAARKWDGETCGQVRLTCANPEADFYPDGEVILDGRYLADAAAIGKFQPFRVRALGINGEPPSKSAPIGLAFPLEGCAAVIMPMYTGR